MTQVAVVILNYNGRHYLEQFLPALIDFTKDAAIVIADNASTDDSLDFLKNEYPSLRVVELSKNYGFAEGYNQALAQVDAELYVLLNSDIQVTQDWLSPLTDFLFQNQEYAACQPKVLDFNNKDQFEHAGAAGGFIDALGYPFCRGRVMDTLERDHGQYDQPIDIHWATGACLLIRSIVYHEIGGLDKDFFAHMEEIDLCWRVRASGLKIKCIPSSAVFHVGGGTLSKTNPGKTFLNFRNALFLLLKNMPTPSLLWKLPLRILLDWLALLVFFFSGKGSHSIAVLKAHAYFMLGFWKTLNKRKQMKAGLLIPYSILVGYYLRGKKYFSDY